MKIEQENELLKQSFAENEALLKAIYRLLIGIKISDADKDTIKSIFKSKELFNAVRKRFLPNLEDDVPLGHMSDEWAHIDNMIFGKSVDTITQATGMAKVALDLTKKSLPLLENPYGEQIDVHYEDDESDKLKIKLLGRNLFIRNCALQLQGIWTIVNLPDTTEQESNK